jgi:UDP-glucose 4-epimerase
MTFNLLEICRAKRWIGTSSVYIYSGEDLIPFSETSLSLPSEYLGASKMACEALLKAEALSSGFSATVLRLFTVYGPSARKTQLIPQVVEKLLASTTEVQLGPGDSVRDFIYIDDVVEAYVLALSQECEVPYSVYNIGSGVGTSVREVVEVLKKLLNIDKQVDFAKSGRFSTKGHLADVRIAYNLLGWKPTYSLEQGLSHMLSENR